MASPYVLALSARPEHRPDELSHNPVGVEPEHANPKTPDPRSGTRAHRLCYDYYHGYHVRELEHGRRDRLIVDWANRAWAPQDDREWRLWGVQSFYMQYRSLFGFYDITHMQLELDLRTLVDAFDESVHDASDKRSKVTVLVQAITFEVLLKQREYDRPWLP